MPYNYYDRPSELNLPLNLNGCDTSLIRTYSQVGRKNCFYSQRAKLHAPRSRAHSAGDNMLTVNQLHVFLSSQPWNKKENVRSNGSENGKRCTLACTSHVASGVENGQAAPLFAESGTPSDFRRCASSSLGLLTGLSGVVACRFPSLSIPRSLFRARSLCTENHV